MTKPVRLVPHTESAGEPKSTQGEQQEKAAVKWASEATINRWVNENSPGVVACRERNRHDPPTIAETHGLHFDDIDEDGFHLRRTRCKSCKLVDIVEQWDVRHRGNVVLGAERVASRPDYSVRGPNGEKYLGPPGQGRFRPKDVRSVLGTQTIKGMKYTALRKETMVRARQIAEGN